MQKSLINSFSIFYHRGKGGKLRGLVEIFFFTTVVDEVNTEIWEIVVFTTEVKEVNTEV